METILVLAFSNVRTTPLRRTILMCDYNPPFIGNYFVNHASHGFIVQAHLIKNLRRKKNEKKKIVGIERRRRRRKKRVRETEREKSGKKVKKKRTRERDGEKKKEE